MIKVIGIRFRNSGKVYYFDPQEMPLRNGQKAIVETSRGLECGSVVLSPRLIAEEHVVQPLRPILRLATEEDLEQERENRKREEEAYRICHQKITEHGLEMKLIKCEYTFDRKKILFYFTAEGRVDFRDLVKDLASIFKTRIELRQIGVRDETKILGGIGICGRPLCCSTFLSDFSSVSIKMAKEQNLSLNPTKISGACGRLMCCLKNEQETYEYLNKNLPGVGDIVEISGERDGDEPRTGEVQTVNVLRQSARVLVEIGEDKEIEEVPADRLEVVMTRRKKNKERVKERERLSREKKERERALAAGEILPDENPEAGEAPEGAGLTGRKDRSVKTDLPERDDRSTKENPEKKNRSAKENPEKKNRSEKEAPSEKKNRSEKQGKQTENPERGGGNGERRSRNRKRSPKPETAGNGPEQNSETSEEAPEQRRRDGRRSRRRRRGTRKEDGAQNNEQ